jgi:hypothetical protein
MTQTELVSILNFLKMKMHGDLISSERARGIRILEMLEIS